jgi:hypothetical protein
VKALTFSIVSAAVSIAYSLGCFLYFRQPFWGFTAICVGALVAAYPLYFERQRINLIEESQVAQFLSENLSAIRGGSVIQQKLAQIKAELDTIKSGHVSLTYSELATATELRMREELSKTMAGYRRQNAQRFPNLGMRRFLPSKKLWPLSVRMSNRVDGIHDASWAKNDG